MILEQITMEVSNRSFLNSNTHLQEINKAVNLASETKKPILLKKNKPKITKQEKTPIEELQEKIKRITNTKNTSKDESVKTKSKKVKEIEETIEEVKEEIDELRVVYDQLETEYNTAKVDYESLFSYLKHNVNRSAKYDSTADLQGPTSLVISDDQAEETIQKIQISYLVGNSDEVSYKDKEKLNNWMIFNQSLRSLYEVLSPIKNRNVDYSKMN